MTDLLSLACSRIVVASAIKQPFVFVPNSTIVSSFLLVLVRLGYISSFKILDAKLILVYLKYIENKPAIRRLLRISTPGNRVFWRSDLSRSRFGNFQGFVLISTNKGLLSDQECRLYNIGGEPLVFVV